MEASSLFDLSGKVAVITGGSRGIGKGAARGLAAAGADVVIASRKLENCEAVVIEQLLQAFPPRRKRILELLLEGRAACDVAQLVQVSERTVYTTRQAAGDLLRQFLADD